MIRRHQQRVPLSTAKDALTEKKGLPMQFCLPAVRIKACLKAVNSWNGSDIVCTKPPTESHWTSSSRYFVWKCIMRPPHLVMAFALVPAAVSRAQLSFVWWIISGNVLCTRELNYFSKNKWMEVLHNETLYRCKRGSCYSVSWKAMV